jgi:uncharacterized membrane protein
MDPDGFRAPAFFSLILFLGANYLIGYGIGYGLTRSIIGAIAVALVTPCVTLFVYALLTGSKARRRRRPE